MARRRQLYEGKAKILYEGPEPGTLVQYFKDDATALNGEKKGIITGKGVLNNRISEYLMLRLGEIGVPTHFVRRLNMREQLIREVEIIPIEVVVRNVAAGSLSTRLGIAEGTRLPRSIIEYYYKNEQLHNPIVCEEHITAFGWANTQDMDDIVALTLRINDFLAGLFLGVGITLVDFKIEFRRDQPGQLPAVGHQDQRKDGQGPLPPRPGQGRGSLSGSGQAAGHPARSRDARPQGPGDDAVKAKVTVMLKTGVLDPQGKAIGQALHNLGFGNVGEVRAGKVIELELAETDAERARAQAEEMARRLLANTVIESYRVEVA
jgi:phosphoribosylaminoimidazole-succinocarboxamide synthase